MGVSYTPSQQQVIDLRERNLLVSAAAGSGKTAVLVERIIQMISDEAHPIDIDRLLIVTFTNAAAAQMRERISAAIAKKLQEMPDSVHLQKQSTLVHNAQITTIDSFCLFVIRNNFNDIGLDPSFRAADEGELKLLRQDVLKELLEEHFAAKEESFYRCLESFSESGSEKQLCEQILNLYRYAVSCPWPQEWLLERRRDYALAQEAQLEEAPFIRYALSHAKKCLAGMAGELQEAAAFCALPDGPYMYENVLSQDIQMLGKAAETEGFFQMAQAFGSLSFARLPIKKDDTVCADKREAVKQARNKVKAAVKKLQERYFYLSGEQILAQIHLGRETVAMLLTLTQEFYEKLAAKKREKKIVDFGDMEHFALDILLHRENGVCVPTRAALEYREYFAQIMIDEYQDSNMVQELLLQSISKEEAGGFNRFMVGDIKQSIYKFRLARPEIFMEKCASYTKGESVRQRIDLQRNFRSRSVILDSVNFIFRQIMDESLGGVSYDDETALYAGADYPPSGADNATQLLLLEKEEGQAAQTEGETDDKALEACMIAGRIKELMREFTVKDEETAQMRKVRYGDIVILLRTNAGWDDVFRRVLAAHGIPCHAASKTGYFSATEVSSVLHVLRVIDNPLQDIPLIGMLHSVFGQFTKEETAIIRAAAHDGREKMHYYDALKWYAANGSAPLCAKAAAFLEKLARYREMVCVTPIQEFLRFLLSDNGYLAYIAALPAGEQRLANVEMLLEKAADFGKTSYFGLFHFIRYIEQMEKYDVDYGEANTLHENADAVRIMSIHKSKGLEFPVCIVAGLAKPFNRREAAGALLLDLDMGIAIDCIDPVRRFKAAGLRKNILADKIRIDSLGEELRVLYVAMTRTKEKLILTGVVKDLRAELLKFCVLSASSAKKLSFLRIAESGNYLALILQALMRHACFAPLLCEYGLEGACAVSPGNSLLGDMHADMQVRIVHPGQMEAAGLVEAYAQEGWRVRLQREADREKPCDEKLYALLQERFSFVYPHKELAGLFAKTTVSELKRGMLREHTDDAKALYEPEEIVPYIPRFVEKEQGMGGASRGSAYHKVMELLPLCQAKTAQDAIGCMQKFLEDGRMRAEYVDVVSPQKIEIFLQSSLCGRMRRAEAAGMLYKEQPFVLGIPAKCLNESFPQEETVLIQGIIDAFFLEDGQIIVLDYKTDAVKTEGELIQRYKIQLDYYAKALEKLLQKPVKEKWIYSFALGRAVIL